MGEAFMRAYGNIGDDDFVARVQPLIRNDPDSVGFYRIIGRLGIGGMGVVYLGRSPAGLFVAIKTVRAEYAADEEFRKRFAREVAAARRVSALYTAPVVEADPDAETPWFATTFVSGPSLAAYVASQGPLSLKATQVLAAGLAEGLEAIHGAGLIHRDLKPGNILLTRAGPCIIDFGIALAPENTRMTGSVWLGTAGYAAPERFDVGVEDASGDIFSLGATMVYAVTGHALVGEGSPMTQIVKIARGRYDLEGVPKPLRSIIVRCVSRNPRDRPTASELRRILVGFNTPEEIDRDWYRPEQHTGEAGTSPVHPIGASRLSRRQLIAAAVAGLSATSGAADSPLPSAWLGIPLDIAPAALGPAIAFDPKGDRTHRTPGELIWRTDLPAGIITVTDERVFAVHRQGLRAHWSADGSIAWELIHVGFTGAPLAWRDAIAIRASTEGGIGVAVLTLATGAIRYTITNHNIMYMGLHQGRLLIGTATGLVAELHHRGGLTPLHQAPSRDGAVTAIATTDQTHITVAWQLASGPTTIRMIPAAPGGSPVWTRRQSAPRVHLHTSRHRPGLTVVITEDNQHTLMRGIARDGTSTWQATLPATGSRRTHTANHTTAIDVGAWHAIDIDTGLTLFVSDDLNIHAATPDATHFYAINHPPHQQQPSLTVIDPQTGAATWHQPFPEEPDHAINARIAAASNTVCLLATDLHTYHPPITD